MLISSKSLSYCLIVADETVEMVLHYLYVSLIRVLIGQALTSDEQRSRS